MSDSNGTKEAKTPLKVRINRRIEEATLDRVLFRVDDEIIVAMDKALEPTAESKESLASLKKRVRCWSK